MAGPDPHEIGRIDTDVAVVGSGAAGLMCLLHAADPTRISRATSSRARAPSANPAARAWCKAATTASSTRPTPSTSTSTTRSRRPVPQRPGARLGPGQRFARPHHRARKPPSAASSTATPTARIHQKPFAGQSFDRTVHKGDLTGIEIMSRPPRLGASDRARGRSKTSRARLPLRRAGGVVGAVLLDNRRGRSSPSRPRHRLRHRRAATMYRISSPSLEKPPTARPWPPGARVRRHGDDAVPPHRHPRRHTRSPPAGCSKKASAAPAPTCSTRSANATWSATTRTNSNGSTRDVVVPRGYMEIMAGRGTPAGGVLLDVTHLGAAESSTSPAWSSGRG